MNAKKRALEAKTWKLDMNAELWGSKRAEFETWKKKNNNFDCND